MKKSFLVVSMLLSSLVAFAGENVLQTIQIEPVRDTYNVVLISDKAVDVKKTVEPDNTVLFSMKGIRASEMLNTVYNGTANIDSVVVTPKSKEELDIRIKGDNVERATVTFDSLAKTIKVASAPAKKEIVLNKPMKTYEPVFTEEEVAETATVSIAPLGQKIIGAIKKIYNNQNNKNMINFGLLALVLFYGIKLVRTKETSEIKVGLAQGLAEREINMYKPMQTPVTNNFTSATNKPYTSVNYGLNAYRNVNRNPYDTATPRVNRTVSSPIDKANLQRALSAATAVAEPTPAVSQPKVATTTSNIDNVKFLETMTAIYEKSGRHDLAQGIKANLSKVK